MNSILISAFMVLGLLFKPQISAAEDYNFDNPDFCQNVLIALRTGAIGALKNPIEELQIKFGKKIYDQTVARGLFEFEDDIIQLFLVAPEFRDLKSFATRWNLKEDEAFDVLLYYGTQVFYGDVRTVGDPRTALQRLRTLSKNYFLETHPLLNAHKQFYEKNLTQLSVPEMAHELNVTEGEVYDELALLELSIVTAFERNNILSRATELLATGMDIDTVARTLNVGAQALRFITHFMRTHNRGFSWQRILHFEGHLRIEEEILATLFRRFLNYSEIADILNNLSQNKSDSPNFRTEKSVYAKLSQMGIIERNARVLSPDIFTVEYGYLKQHGDLVSTSVINFLFDHYAYSDEWLASKLEIEIKALRLFYHRHHIVRLELGDGFRYEAESDKKILEKYQEQIVTVDRVLDWINVNGAMPKQTDFRMSEVGKIKVSFHRFFGYGTARDNDAIFNSPAEAWLALKKRGEARGIKVSLLDAGILKYTTEFKRILREEALDKVVDWMIAHDNRAPRSHVDFGFGSGEVGISASKLMGLGEYSDGDRLSHLRIFDSPTDTWLAIKEAAAAGGINLRLIDLPLREIEDDKLRPFWKEEVLKEVLAWIEKRKAVPNFDELRTIKIRSARLYPGRRGPERAIDPKLLVYADRLEFWNALKTEVEKKNSWVEKSHILDEIEIQIRNAKIEDNKETGLSEERDKAVALVIEYIKNKGHFPTLTDFKEGKLKTINVEQFFGKGHYSQGHTSEAKSFFKDSSEAILAVKDVADFAGVQFSLLKTKITSVRQSEKMRNALRKEALNRMLDWLIAHPGETFTSEDFKSKDLDLNRARILGIAEYSPGALNYNSRLYDSPAEAWAAVAKLAQERGVPFTSPPIHTRSKRKN